MSVAKRDFCGGTAAYYFKWTILIHTDSWHGVNVGYMGHSDSTGRGRPTAAVAVTRWVLIIVFGHAMRHLDNSRKLWLLLQNVVVSFCLLRCGRR